MYFLDLEHGSPGPGPKALHSSSFLVAGLLSGTHPSGEPGRVLCEGPHRRLAAPEAVVVLTLPHSAHPGGGSLVRSKESIEGRTGAFSKRPR